MKSGRGALFIFTCLLVRIRDDVERMSGLDFLNVIDKETEEKIEGERAMEVWQ